MYIGYCKITLQLPEIHDLKGKRQIVRSLIDKLNQRFNIAISEVDHHDLWQLADIGMSCVSNDKIQLEKLIDQLIQYVSQQAGNFQIINIQENIESVFQL